MRANLDTPRRIGNRGYTLIEMLVVVMIILLLLGISVAGVGGFFSRVGDTSMKQFLASIAIALTAYENEHGDFPSTGNATAEQGAPKLVDVLMDPNDNHPWDPYLSLGNENTITIVNSKACLTSMTSKARRPILYYRAHSGGTMGVSNIWSAGGRFDTADNGEYDGSNNPAAYWMGSEPTSDEKQAFAVRLRSARWLLSAPGGDDVFGTVDDVILTGP